MDELVDIVNHADEVIGTVPKSLGHRDKLLHRGATVLIFRDYSMQETLLQVRSNQHKANAGKYGFTGGHIHSGDSYLEGALKELKEEMFNGHELPRELELKFLFKFFKTADNDPEIMAVYSTVWPGPFEINNEEVQSYSFEDVKLLPESMAFHPEKFTGTTKAVFNEYLKRGALEYFLHQQPITANLNYLSR